MMTETHVLESRLRERFSGVFQQCRHWHDEVTVELMAQDLLGVCLALRDEPGFEFCQLMDLCVVDLLAFASDEWETVHATRQGFERGVQAIDWDARRMPEGAARFRVVYHLLSLSNNQRVRIHVPLLEADPVIHSVVEVWPSANWFEREAYDLFGVVFEQHPDLRRILTDYGFVGHPFRKDFPMSGHVEVRYDAKQQRVIYHPVDIEPRTLVPKVIRNDQRYPVQDEE
jgi:NADH-quinone oxidoreductase subunit C